MNKEPAYPAWQEGKQHPGITVEDYFAGQALCGILACNREYRGAENMEARVAMCYRYARQMMKERDK